MGQIYTVWFNSKNHLMQWSLHFIWTWLEQGIQGGCPLYLLLNFDFINQNFWTKQFSPLLTSSFSFLCIAEEWNDIPNVHFYYCRIYLHDENGPFSSTNICLRFNISLTGLHRVAMQVILTAICLVRLQRNLVQWGSLANVKTLD